MAKSVRYDFEAGVLIPSRDTEGGEVLVADSFRVEDGYAVAAQQHWQRFRAAARAQGLDEELLTAFWNAVVKAIPPRGAWFPRIECLKGTVGRRLCFLQREAPPRQHSLILARAPYDPRTSPTVKGPDLQALGQLRRVVAGSGAGEAVIVDGDGWIVEGAWSSIVVWDKAHQTLSVVPDGVARVPSVTELVVCEIAEELSHDIRPELTAVEDLAGREVWVLSALHGIRVATEFLDGPPLGVESGFVERFRERVRPRAVPLSDLAD